MTKIAIDSYGSLKRGGSMMYRGAKLERMGEYFVMTGKSGTHSLLVAATDRERLSAHWVHFANHPANA